MAGFSDYSAGRHLKFERDPYVIPHAFVRGTSRELAVGVINGSGDRVSLIGSADRCARVCLSSRGLPITIEPTGTAQVLIHIDTMVPGHFSEALTFYTDCASQPTLVLNVKGFVEIGNH
jgi:hypothetical protein